MTSELKLPARLAKCMHADSFFARFDILSRFLFGMVFTWNSEGISLFESNRSDSVSFNVILITRGTILFIPQNAQLLTRCHLIGISRVACWGRKYDEIV